MSTEVQIRQAATVMLVRDGDEGLEVFMLRRNLNSDFVGGAYVFPGGAVDPDDSHRDLEAICEGLSDAEAATRLALDPPTGGLAYWVAAIRESFEEAGVLLAYTADGAMIDLHEPAAAERFALHRKAVDSSERSLFDVCVEEGLRLAVDGIQYFSHWITPEGPPRRYDTRFFVARAPERQSPLHDDRETIANIWVRPSDALDRHRRNELELIFPTIRNLEAIADYRSADELLEAAAKERNIAAVQPRIVMDESGVRILIPGDPGYDEAG